MHTMKSPTSPAPLSLALLLAAAPAARSQDSALPADHQLAAHTLNALGIDLLREGTSKWNNALLSPYSLQTALAMAYAGADGETRREMAAVLHYPEDEAALHTSMARLRQALDSIAQETAKQAADTADSGSPSSPVELTTANRLFGQQGYEFRPAFLDLLANTYHAPLELVDYLQDAPGARMKINRWVEQQTRERIRDLIPPNALNEFSRLVLVNAAYLKAPWLDTFPKTSTRPKTFTLWSGQRAEVDTMSNRSGRYGYAREDGFQVVTLPYTGGKIQFLVLLPDTASTLGILESQLNTELLVKASRARAQDVALELPRFKIEPPSMPLSRPLQKLGMKTAFDIPEGSADFDRMAPRRPPDDYLLISEVFHKTFLNLDESITEAAAATGVLMARPTSMAPERVPEPIRVKVNRPFLFAIQHRSSGACLFLGRVTDPRL